MRYLKYGLSTFLFIILITILFIVVSTLTGQTYQEILPENKQPDHTLSLTGYSFEHIAYIDSSYFDWYPAVYYTPEDFAQGKVTAPVSSFVPNTSHYGTLRLRIRLKEGQVYAISSYSTNYAQRLYINGIQYPSAGSPGTSAKTNIAGTNYYLAAFEPREQIAEIVIHQSNFVHSDGGGIFPLYLGYQWQISQAHQASQLRINIMVGCMMTVCLLFFGLFLFFPRRQHLLWFSLTCLAIAVRTIIVEQKTIMALFKNMSWEFSIRLEYLVLVGLLTFLPLYVHHFFGRPLGKWLAVAEGIIGAIYTLMVVCMKPITFTRYILLYQWSAIIIGIIMILSCLWNAIHMKKYRSTEHLMLLAAIITFAIIAIPDVYMHKTSGTFQYETNLTQAGMMVFIFINMLAQILGFFRTEGELQQARQAEQELQAERNLLDRLNKLKNDYLSNITHEMKTPLSVMAGYAQLTRWQMEQGTADTNTLENLKTVSSEAHRLAKMAEQLLELSASQQNISTTDYVQLQDACEQIIKLCKPLLMKNNNSITFEADADCPPAGFHPDSIIQVLLNVISNADRHTKNGTIQLKLSQSGNYAMVTVSDNGSGIAPDQLPDIFQRGSSADGRTGLGLSICKEMVEDSGGTIDIESTLGEGTTITLMLPLYLKDEGEQ